MFAFDESRSVVTVDSVSLTVVPEDGVSLTMVTEEGVAGESRSVAAVDGISLTVVPEDGVFRTMVTEEGVAGESRGLVVVSDMDAGDGTSCAKVSGISSLQSSKSESPLEFRNSDILRLRGIDSGNMRQ